MGILGIVFILLAKGNVIDCDFNMSNIDRHMGKVYTSYVYYTYANEQNKINQIKSFLRDIDVTRKKMLNEIGRNKHKLDGLISELALNDRKVKRGQKGIDKNQLYKLKNDIFLYELNNKLLKKHVARIEYIIREFTRSEKDGKLFQWIDKRPYMIPSVVLAIIYLGKTYLKVK